MPSVFGIEFHIWADGAALAFAIAAIVLCSVQIHHHIYHGHDPDTRRHIIRILLMVVVYSIESWMGLYSPAYAIYLDAIRDSYEALVIYSFYQLLVQSMGGYEQVESFLYLVPDQVMTHVWPFHYVCAPWTFSDTSLSPSGFYNSVGTRDGDRDRDVATGTGTGSGTFLKNCSYGVLQYCVVQPLCALATFVMQLTGTYGESTWQWNVGYPYIAFVRSASQTWAIYCLAIFYLALKKQPTDSDGYALFRQIRPVPKFLCIKGVVFFTYWQSICLSLFVWMGVIKATEHWNEDDLAVGLQDFLICIEMFFAAIAHVFAFRVADFQECRYAPLLPAHRVIFDVANVGDVASEAKDALRESVSDLKLLRKKKRLRGPVAISQGMGVAAGTGTGTGTGTSVELEKEAHRHKKRHHRNFNLSEVEREVQNEIHATMDAL